MRTLAIGDIHGQSAALEALRINTGAGHGLWLTCLDVGSGTYWQANSRCKTRSGRLVEPT